MAYRFVARVGATDIRVPLAAGRYRVGSAPECEILLQDPTVSRQHALIEVSGDELRLTDLGSRNGTRLDGRSIAEGEARAFVVGSALRFGQVDARLDEIGAGELEAAVAGETAAPATGGTAPPGTLASGDYGSFCLHRLPALLDRLAGDDGLAGFAGALAEALHRAMPETSLDIFANRSGTPAVVARCGSPVPDPQRHSASSGCFRIELERPRGADARTSEALVALALRLLRLADRPAAADAPAPAPRPGPPSPPDPATQDARLREIYHQAGIVGGGGVNVVIEGESGTGKELLARYLHAAGGEDRPWVALNCASLPRDLLEAELFGIDKGVATGVEARAGKFEQAHGGTLFLDEIGDMAPESQAKILRVLQEREVYRLGSSRPRPAEVCVVAATNRPLEQLVSDGGFRLDLYHRLADWTVRLPPLRERRGDVANLAAHFLARACARRGMRFGGISKAALAVLESSPWPGNVRQLEREMQRVALFLNDGEMLQSDQLQPGIRQGAPQGAQGGTLAERLREHEAEIIGETLRQCSGDVAATAKALGVGRSTLYRRIGELGLEGDD